MVGTKRKDNGNRSTNENRTRQRHDLYMPPTSCVGANMQMMDGMPLPSVGVRTPAIEGARVNESTPVGRSTLKIENTPPVVENTHSPSESKAATNGAPVSGSTPRLVSSANQETPKLYIKPREKEFVPSDPTINYIGDIIENFYTGVWETWLNIPASHRSMMFVEFGAKELGRPGTPIENFERTHSKIDKETNMRIYVNKRAENIAKAFSEEMSKEMETRASDSERVPRDPVQIWCDVAGGGKGHTYGLGGVSYTLSQGSSSSFHSYASDSCSHSNKKTEHIENEMQELKRLVVEQSEKMAEQNKMISDLMMFMCQNYAVQQTNIQSRQTSSSFVPPPFFTSFPSLFTTGQLSSQQLRCPSHVSLLSMFGQGRPPFTSFNIPSTSSLSNDENDADNDNSLGFEDNE